MRYLDLIVEATKPYIHAHRAGSVMWIDMMAVPMRGQGFGRRYYEQWEAKLPKDITLIRLEAADAGHGMSNGFWEAMGFEYNYTGDALEDHNHEMRNYMWKGVNGHPTPESVPVEDDENDSDAVTETSEAKFDDRRDRLRALLLAVRRKLIKGRMSSYGDCELVAEEFLSYARGEGLVAVDPHNPREGEGEIVLGYRGYDEAWCKRFMGYVPEPGQHQWVEIDGMIYDGTADQFGERRQEVFITPASDPQYRVHQRTTRSFMRATPFPAKPSG